LIILLVAQQSGSGVIDYAASEWRTVNREHFKERPFKCTWDQTCTKAFAHRTSLSSHLEYHKNPEACRCKPCDKYLASKSKLDRHIKGQRHLTKAATWNQRNAKHMEDAQSNHFDPSHDAMLDSPSTGE